MTVAPSVKKGGEERLSGKKGARRLPSDIRIRQSQSNLKGEQGFRKSTVTTEATNPKGDILWEESYWDASDWNGLKELGAVKSGHDSRGKSWREEWKEKMYFDSVLQCHAVHKSCSKWCRHVGIDEEWEESWEEYFVKGGRSERRSKKWGRKGFQSWHENWGDVLDAHGNGHLWTDKWYEDVFEAERRVQWGEKWEGVLETACEVSKWGENWRKSEGDVYHRWWRENKNKKDGTISRSGNSTSGERWDVTDHLKDGDLFPVVRVDRYAAALEASPQLQAVYVHPGPQ